MLGNLGEDIVSVCAVESSRVHGAAIGRARSVDSLAAFECHDAYCGRKKVRRTHAC